MDLPDEVKDNPTILELELLAIDLTIIANVSSWSFSFHMVGRISLLLQIIIGRSLVQQRASFR